jgi:hypothetical protein
MDKFYYIFGFVSFFSIGLILLGTLISKVMYGFEPTSIQTEDSKGNKYWVPYRIYHAITFRTPFNLDGGGNFNDFYTKIANNNPHRLIKVTSEHNIDWVWYRQFLRNRNKGC